MQPSIIYNVFIRDFRKQKKRITLTLLALGWGTMSIMLMLGFGEGLHQQLAKNKNGMGSNIMILWAGQTSIPYKGMGKGRNLHFLKEDIEFVRESLPELKEVGGEFDRWGIKAEHDGNVQTAHVNGVTPNYEQIRNMIPEMGGRMVNQIDVDKKRRVIFLGWTLKDKLFGVDNAIGKQVTLNNVPFTVIGVMKKKISMGNYNGMDSDRAVIPISTFEATYGDPYLDDIVCQLYPGTDSKVIEKKLFEAFGGKYKFDPKDDRAISIWDTVAGSNEFDNILMGIKFFLGIIGGLTLLIAGVGVANIMYVSIKERTREIGIKMAVGARKSFILTQFLIEALMITFLGGFGGMSISYILTEAFKRIPLELDVLDLMGRPTISFEIGLIVIIILSIIGFLSGLFPAMKAASVSPVESLRYE